MFGIGLFTSAFLAIFLPPIGTDENKHWWKIMYLFPILTISIQLISLLFIYDFKTPKFH
jgi:hypothetical protein